MDKPDLISKVEERCEKFGPFLTELARGREAAKMLLEVISAAEVRLAVALANIEGEDEGVP